MAKFYGKVGFVLTQETEEGSDIWDTVETEKPYCGDLIRSQRRWESGESVNENLTVSNEVSLLMDDFLQVNIGYVKWIECMGAKWKVQSITLNYPRVNFTLGGVYNGG